jgi:hypothetical protein
MVRNGDSTILSPWNKSKTTAIVLALFLGLFTWLYTWQKSKSKFIIGGIIVGGSILLVVGLCLLVIIANGFSIPEGEDALAFIIGIYYIVLWIIPIHIAVWIWAIIDSIIKKSSWYKT